MVKEDQNRKILMPMEMELEPVSKIQVLNSSQNKKHQLQTNLDEVCQFEDEETPNVEFRVDYDLEVGVLPAFLHDEDRRYRKKNLTYNFSAIYFMCWIKMSPFGVDPSSKNYPRVGAGHKNWWKNAICFGWFFLTLIRTFGFILPTVHFVLTEDAEEELGRMTLMILLSICATIGMNSATSVFFYTKQHAAVFLNSGFNYLDDESEEKMKSAEKGPWKFGLGFRSHTLKELLMIHFPFLLFPIAGIIPLMSIVDPSFPLLLVHVVPSDLRFSLVFFSVALFDSIICTYYVMLCHMVFYFFIGMHRIQEEAQLTIKLLAANHNSPGAWDNLEAVLENRKLWRALKSLRLVHIWTRFFNTSFSQVIYNAKLVALLASILGGFGLIKMLEVENWPYAGVFGLAFLEGVIVYNVVFGRAYEIPEKVQELKREIRQLSYKMRRPNQNQKLTSDELKYMEKFLKSIPWLGVKDGVYKMERMTSANFLAFVIQQITGLVLAY